MTDNMTLEGPRDLEALLPWYLNGTASEDERAAIEAWLDEDPHARQLLDAMRDEQETAITANNEIEVPDTEAGLAALMASIDAPQAAEEPAQRRVRDSRPGLMARLAAWLPTPGLRLAGALGAILVVAQAAVIGVMLATGPGTGAGESPADGQTDGFVTASDGGDASTGLGPRFLMQFPADLTVAELGEVLAEHDLRLVDSPAEGIFEVELVGDATDEAAAAAAEAELDSDDRLMLIGRSN